MGNEIFEEIKRKYKKSNKYMLYVSYEDIGILIQIIEMLEKENCHETCGIKKLIDCGRQCSIGCTIKILKKYRRNNNGTRNRR